MLNKTKQIKLRSGKVQNSQLFMLEKNKCKSYIFSTHSCTSSFPKFSLSSKTRSLPLYTLTDRTIRDYLVFENFRNKKETFSAQSLANRLLLIKKLYERGISFLGSQIDKNKGGNFAASLGFISFVPRRHRASKARASQSFMGLKMIFRRYRKISSLYNIKVNLVSTFRPNFKTKGT